MYVLKSSIAPIDFDGLSIFDYTAGHDLSSSLAFIEVPSGTGHPKAWSRRSDKYYLVTRGQVDFVIDDERRGLAAGDFCFIRQGQVFSYANVAVEAAAVVLVHTPAFDLTSEVFVD